MAEAYQHEEIAKLAYELWERRGRPVGSPDIDWYAAEGALGLWDSQQPFSLVSVRMGQKKVPTAKTEFEIFGALS